MLLPKNAAQMPAMSWRLTVSRSRVPRLGREACQMFVSMITQPPAGMTSRCMFGIASADT